MYNVMWTSWPRAGRLTTRLTRGTTHKTVGGTAAPGGVALPKNKLSIYKEDANPRLIKSHDPMHVGLTWDIDNYE